jgi:hypothetical protein
MRHLEASEIKAIAERHGVSAEWLRARLALADEQGWMDEKGHRSWSALLEILERAEVE